MGVAECRFLEKTVVSSVGSRGGEWPSGVSHHCTRGGGGGRPTVVHLLGGEGSTVAHFPI